MQILKGLLLVSVLISLSQAQFKDRSEFNETLAEAHGVFTGYDTATQRIEFDGWTSEDSMTDRYRKLHQVLLRDAAAADIKLKTLKPYDKDAPLEFFKLLNTVRDLETGTRLIADAMIENDLPNRSVGIAMLQEATRASVLEQRMRSVLQNMIEDDVANCLKVRH